MRRTMTQTLRGSAVALLFAALLPGCVMQSARPDRASMRPEPGAFPPLAWPARKSPSQLSFSSTLTVGTTTLLRRGFVRSESRFIPKAVETQLSIDAIAPDENGILLTLSGASPKCFDHEYLSEFSVPGHTSNVDSSLPVGLEMTWMMPEGDEPPRGTVVQLFSFSPSYEQPLTQALLRDGWSVLCVPYPLASWERINVPLDESRRAEAIAGASRLATIVDERFAEIAYAVDSVLTERADDTPGPIVVLGASAGGNATPAVTLYLREQWPKRLKAMVVVAGAADIFLTAFASVLDDTGLDVSRNGAPVPPSAISHRFRAELDEIYLRDSRLDPSVVAPRLCDLPVLQVEAVFDNVVPSRLQRETWERLGRPDRYRIFTGHHGIFLGMRFLAPGIVDWIDDTVPRSADD